MIDLTAAGNAISRDLDRSRALLGALGADDWSRSTRLPGWTVGDLGSHLVAGQRLQRGAWAAANKSAAPPDPSADRPSPDQVLAELALAADGFAAELASATEDVLGGTVVMPYGTLPAMLVLQLAVMEAGVHRSDLDAAIERDDSLDDDTCSAVWTVLAAFLPTLGASGTDQPASGAVIRLQTPTMSIAVAYDGSAWSIATPETPATTTISGTDSDVALFALGRRGGDDARLAIDGDAHLAHGFKAMFPGP